MVDSRDATDELIDGRDAGAGAQPVMLTIKGVATTCGVSDRHFRRLVDSGAAPQPVRLGRLLRWPRAQIEAWIANGCQPVRGGGQRS